MVGAKPMDDMCPNCGQSIASDAPTCIYCGATLGPPIGAPAAAPAPVSTAATEIGPGDLLLDDEAVAPVPVAPPPTAPRPQAMSHAATMQAQVSAPAPPPPPPPPPAAPAPLTSDAAPGSIPGLQLGAVDHSDPSIHDPSAMSAGGPSLELASDPPARVSRTGATPARGDEDDDDDDLLPAAPDSVPPPRLSAADRKRARLDEVAGYGSVPDSVVKFPLYFVKVFLRKRVVTNELLQLTKVRKRASQSHVDALCQVGETLHVRRTDPSLAPLARHFEVIEAADSAIDRQAEEGAASRQDALQELESLARKIETIEAQIAPLEQRSGQIMAHTSKLSEKMAEAESAATKLDAELVRLGALEAPSPEDRARQQQVAAKREQVSQVMARIDAELSPRQQEVDALAGKVNKHRRAVADLVAERDSLSEIMGRERDRQAVEAGASRGELREALRSLAEAAIEQGLTAHAGALVEKVEKLDAELKRKREHEGLYRAALNSYDEEAYTKGGYLLVGGTGGLMLLLLILIFG